MTRVTPALTHATTAHRLSSLRAAYQEVRGFSRELCEPLVTEDFVIQSMPDASPTRWHLAHTTWFFETFVLQAYVPNYRSSNAQFAYLFNSYYNTVGKQFSRPHRGLLSRPTVAEIYQYRSDVDRQVLALLDAMAVGEPEAMLDVLELGIHHEQQHQELMLTDIKHVFFCNPLLPTYRAFSHSQVDVDEVKHSSAAGHEFPEFQFLPGLDGVVEIGDQTAGFVFDNERPRHQVLLQPHRIGSRLVTCGEYRRFMEDGGYRRPEFWLSLGWQTVQREAWDAPLYWVSHDGQWQQFTLHGLQPVVDHEPVCHVSFFEADAFARWRGCRLPLEAEWEALAATQPLTGHFADARYFHPRPACAGARCSQLFGDVWQWTASPYTPYPGYAPAAGALGEYNGKFMCNQYVLRGGSCATSRSHVRVTYRNFFPPDARWQFSGFRLAQDDV